MITSEIDPRHPSKTIYTVKATSALPDDQAEVRIAELLSATGNTVHFTKGVGEADLKVNNVLSDVKHLKSADSIPSAISRGRKQGHWVLLDGTSAQLSLESAKQGLLDFKHHAEKHPGPLARVKKIMVFFGAGTQLLEYTRIPGGADLKWPGKHRL